MNLKFYDKMAVSNLKNNKSIYIPFLGMSAFVVMLCFMMHSLICNEDIRNMPHAENILMILSLTLWIVRIFSVIFIFYLNSFLIKRRKKEIGLYHILGLEKKHISYIMFIETVLITAGTLLLGIILGIIFSKLLFLLLYRLIGVSQLPKFALSMRVVMVTVISFSMIFFVTYLYNLIKIKNTNSISLLQGGQLGEKEPKTKILLLILGIIFIGFGYAFALFSKNPLQAFNLFFLAVISVMIGTYSLFVAGSIFLIKMLKKNKRFYYHPKHFNAVAGMLYRMKQNAVGLASICILSTMALISISSTISMYMGMEDVVKSTYPNEITLESSMKDCNNTEKVDQFLRLLNEQNDVEMTDVSRILELEVCSNEENDGSYHLFVPDFNARYKTGTLSALIVEADTFNQLGGTDYQLGEQEILCYSSDHKPVDQITFSGEFGQGTYSIQKILEMSDISDKYGIKSLESLIPCQFIVVKDKGVMKQIQSYYAANNEGEYTYNVLYETNLSQEDSLKYCQDITKAKIPDCTIYAYNQDDMRYEFHQMYGSFLFMGILFGTIFILATTIIIYYKQISEGFDDRERFIIMQKVGMSHEEVRQSIKSQIRIVFSLPLLVAGLHIVVSFRIIEMILKLLSLGNVSLFKICTVLTFLIFIVVYVIVYKMTAKAYYKIVQM